MRLDGFCHRRHGATADFRGLWFVIPGLLAYLHPERHEIYAASVGVGFIPARRALELHAFLGRAKALRYRVSGCTQDIQIGYWDAFSELFELLYFIEKDCSTSGDSQNGGGDWNDQETNIHEWADSNDGS